ncbi:MAG: hypothetical protein JNL13_04415, partial [Chitinophagaceae bacterium]|nr:hypothetical protein [Chitinophagaceae bacterium]
MLSSLLRKKSIHQIQKDAAEGFGDGESSGLHRVLGVRDLTFFGMAA